MVGVSLNFAKTYEYIFHRSQGDLVWKYNLNSLQDCTWLVFASKFISPFLLGVLPAN